MYDYLEKLLTKEQKGCKQGSHETKDQFFIDCIERLHKKAHHFLYDLDRLQESV